jgi:hypothetical protein
MATAILFSIRDDKNETSTLQINVADTVSTADAIAYAETVAPLLDALLVGVIDRIGIAVNVDISGLGLNTSPGTGADVEEGARFQFQTAGGFATGHRVATFTIWWMQTWRRGQMRLFPVSTLPAQAVAVS